MGPVQHHFCPHCGEWLSQESWPRTCSNCGQTTWRNPAPVVVMLVPLLGLKAVLAVRRDIEPDKGKLALPSGYVDWGETWQEAAARELKEETNLFVRPTSLRLFDITSSKNKAHLLVFVQTPTVVWTNAQGDFAVNDEVSGIEAISDTSELCWETHQQMATRLLTATYCDTCGKRER